MNKADVIVVGAGAAGLMAAYTLSKAGRTVIVLEARDRIGGRIHTLSDQTKLNHAELGAEFIHGNLPVTLQLLQEAGIEYVFAGGEMWQHRDGELFERAWDIAGWDELMEKLVQLEQDMSIGVFLQQNFGVQQYDQLREAVTRFVCGYDSADPSKASAFALREEWLGEEEDVQYRTIGGYGKLMDYLEAQSNLRGAEFYLNAVAKKIEWGSSEAKVTISNGNTFTADKIIVALPLGVLKAETHSEAAIAFEPAISDHSTAISQMGFGAIVKLLLQFRNAFWEEQGRDRIGFILSQEKIPTWWTQYPARSTILTGWLGGLPAERQKDLSDEELLKLGIQSLANIFNKNYTDIERELVASEVVNWTIDPFTLGSYAYDMVESHAARKVLSEPAGDRIWFAGEYLYEGRAMGTVEAALSNGLEVAKKIAG